MAEELRKIFDELRENFNNDDDKEEKNKDKGEPDDDDILLQGIDDDKIIEESKKVSIFCRNCLFPYVSEQGKGGSIILKCEKCNHRDVVTDDNLQKTKPGCSESLAMGGNLILNRFQKILLDTNDLCDINLEDPGLIDDDFKTVSEILPRVTSIMKQTFSDMHKVTDDHRKVHNQEMIQRLTDQGQCEIVEAEDGTKSMRFSAPIHGSDETEDLVILPGEYKLPQASIEKFRLVGRKGVQKVDKLILNTGLLTEKLSDMPLFQKRLLNYCKFAQNQKEKKSNTHEKEDESKSMSEKLSGTRDKNDALLGESIDIDTTVQKSEHDIFTDSQVNNSKENSKLERNISDEPVGVTGSGESCNENSRENAPVHIPNTTCELIQIRRDIYVLEKLQEKTRKDKNTDSGQEVNKGDLGYENSKSTTDLESENTQSSTDVESESTQSTINIGATNTQGTTDVEAESTQNTTAAESENPQSTNINTPDDGGCRPKETKVPEEPILDNILPELRQFSDIFFSIEKQQNLATSIPDDEVIPENWRLTDHIPDKISSIEANDAFNEITSSMVQRVSESKAQRMRNLTDYIKRAGRTMAEEVDRVQGDMIKELQIAYHSKRIKADKQRKRLEEAQETLEHYRELVNHYQQTGQFGKLLEIMELLRDYENLN